MKDRNEKTPTSYAKGGLKLKFGQLASGGYTISA